MARGVGATSHGGTGVRQRGRGLDITQLTSHDYILCKLQTRPQTTPYRTCQIALPCPISRTRKTLAKTLPYASFGPEPEQERLCYRMTRKSRCVSGLGPIDIPGLCKRVPPYEPSTDAPHVLN